MPEIMIPLTTGIKEMENQADICRRVAEEVFKEKGTTVEYLVGTMIELPRAALMAEEIAEDAEFFSFGTNDLTQTTFGFSRDDINKFLPYYLKEGIFKQDPFAVLDQEGVGELVKIGTERGRETRPNLKVGICGEHGGEPRVGEVLSPRRHGLRLLLSLPRAYGAAGRSAGRPGRKRHGGRTDQVIALSGRERRLRAPREPAAIILSEPARRASRRIPKLSRKTKPGRKAGLFSAKRISCAYCMRCSLAISFCARLASLSDQSTRPVKRQLFSRPWM